MTNEMLLDVDDVLEQSAALATLPVYKPLQVEVQEILDSWNFYSDFPSKNVCFCGRERSEEDMGIILHESQFICENCIDNADYAVWLWEDNQTDAFDKAVTTERIRVNVDKMFGYQTLTAHVMKDGSIALVEDDGEAFAVKPAPAKTVDFTKV